MCFHAQAVGNIPYLTCRAVRHRSQFLIVVKGNCIDHNARNFLIKTPHRIPHTGSNSTVCSPSKHWTYSPPRHSHSSTRSRLRRQAPSERAPARRQRRTPRADLPAGLQTGKYLLGLLRSDRRLCCLRKKAGSAPSSNIGQSSNNPD